MRRSRLYIFIVIVILLYFVFTYERKVEIDERIQIPTIANSEVLHSFLRRLYLPNVESSFVNPRSKNGDYPPVAHLPTTLKHKVLVTGGAGFIGSHLVDRLMLMGHHVVVVDNLFTGRKRNIYHWFGHPHFEFIQHDVTEPIHLEVDRIYHLASPSAPLHYQYNPIKTIKTNTMGTINMLGLARRVKARILIASAGEIYGNPKQHPQSEDYWGHVNPIGERACYEEGKRVSETITYSYVKQENVNARVARIFNTYGPRMPFHDGRVVSTFIKDALAHPDSENLNAQVYSNITIYGDGESSRSFLYIHDLINGLIALMESDIRDPVNLGSPHQSSIESLADLIKKIQHSESPVLKVKKQRNDVKERVPDITKARRELSWEPKFTLVNGIRETVEYFQSEIDYYNEQL